VTSSPPCWMTFTIDFLLVSFVISSNMAATSLLFYFLCNVTSSSPCWMTFTIDFLLVSFVISSNMAATLYYSLRNDCKQRRRRTFFRDWKINIFYRRLLWTPHLSLTSACYWHILAWLLQWYSWISVYTHEHLCKKRKSSSRILTDI
jgi:hypothetical protein